MRVTYWPEADRTHIRAEEARDASRARHEEQKAARTQRRKDVFYSLLIIAAVIVGLWEF